MSGISSQTTTMSCCSSMPSAFCHAPMHVHPSMWQLQSQLQFSPCSSHMTISRNEHTGSKDFLRLSRVSNFKPNRKGGTRSGNGYGIGNSNLWRRMSRTRPNENFDDQENTNANANAPSFSRKEDQEERYIYDLEDEETLLELLALDDLEELDDDDLDVINLNDLEELKELEQMLNQRGIDMEDDDMDMDIGFDEEDVGFDENIEDDDEQGNELNLASPVLDSAQESTSTSKSSALEQALMQGVVPAAAGVGSNCLPGDYGFDPLGLATKDYFKRVQNFILNLLPAKDDDEKKKEYDSNFDAGAALPRTRTSMKYYDDEQRPPALILRDYREIEIRHGRLAMLAALLWPLQEIIDRLFISELFGKTTIVYGGVTLPYVSLFMTLVMLLLGYLDIYAASIKENDAGDAFLPGECFWDPLRILDGTSESVKRNMQARELNNGRFAMIAVLSYILQESITHQPLITLPWNQVLFEPAFEIPAVQAWLDGQFAGAITGKGVMLIEQERVLEGGEVVKMIIIEDGSGSGSANAAASAAAVADSEVGGDLGGLLMDNISGNESGDYIADAVKNSVETTTDLNPMR